MGIRADLVECTVKIGKMVMKTYLGKKGVDLEAVDRRKVAGKWSSGVGSFKSPWNRREEREAVEMV